MKRIVVSAVLSCLCMAVGYGAGWANQPPPVVIEPEPTVVVEERIVEVSTGIVPHYSEIALTVTDEEIDILGSVIRAEAGNQSFLGQKAVAEVVLNRVLSPQFPDTIKEVVYQKGQFSTTSVLAKYPPTEEQYAVIDVVFAESEPSLPGDVLFFATYPFRDVYERIGDHYFCY